MRKYSAKVEEDSVGVLERRLSESISDSRVSAIFGFSVVLILSGAIFVAVALSNVKMSDWFKFLAIVATFIVISGICLLIINIASFSNEYVPMEFSSPEERKKAEKIAASDVFGRNKEFVKLSFQAIRAIDSIITNSDEARVKNIIKSRDERLRRILEKQ